MEKVRPWCGQPSDRGRLKNRTEPQEGNCMLDMWAGMGMGTYLAAESRGYTGRVWVKVLISTCGHGVYAEDISRS